MNNINKELKSLQTKIDELNARLAALGPETDGYQTLKNDLTVLQSALDKIKKLAELS